MCTPKGLNQRRLLTLTFSLTLALSQRERGI